MERSAEIPEDIACEQVVEEVRTGKDVELAIDELAAHGLWEGVEVGQSCAVHDGECNGDGGVRRELGINGAWFTRARASSGS